MACCSKLNKAFKKVKKYITDDLLRDANIAVNVVEKLKKAIDSNLAITLVSLTPTNVDNNVREKISRALQLFLMFKGYLSQVPMTNDDTLPHYMSNYIKDVKERIPSLVASDYALLAQTITKELNSSRVADNIVDSVVQLTYSTNKLS